MSSQLIEVQNQLQGVMAPLIPTFEQLLPPGLPPERLLQTLYVSCANNPTLMRANRQSLIQAATSAAVLALEIDGVSGQGYLVPFKGQAQFLGGYKGFVTLASRGHRTLEGFVVRDGDSFNFDEAAGTVSHQRTLGNEENRRLVGAYALSRWATGSMVLQQLRVLSIDELLATRNRSAGWRSKGERSTWGTNFDAMCRKTPMRRLSNDLPVLSLQAASALEVQHDLGRSAWLHPDGGVVVTEPGRGSRELSPEEARAEQPGADDLVPPPQTPPRFQQDDVLDAEVVTEAEPEPEGWVITYPDGMGTRSFPSVDEYYLKMLRSIDLAGERRGEFRKLNESYIMGPVREADDGVASKLIAAFDAHS